MGGNQGGPTAVRHHLRRALDRLEAALGPLRVAPLFRTAPVSPIPQPPYLNTAATGTTGWPPERLLALAKELEAEAGRDFDAPRWGPRPLDVDLLLLGDEVRSSGEVGSGEVGGDGGSLILPHPRLRERAFVLAPLARIAPDWPVPPDGRTVADLLADLLAELERRGEAPGIEEVAPLAPSDR